MNYLGQVRDGSIGGGQLSRDGCLDLDVGDPPGQRLRIRAAGENEKPFRAARRQTSRNCSSATGP